jgi:biopolymer transport protein ExbD
METPFRYAPRKKARIEIIPLIDVVFFLLATFVLFTLSLEKIKSVPVIFPKPGEPTVLEDLTIYLQTSESGLFLWKQGREGASEQLSAAELLPRLESYKRTTAQPRVLVSGDDRARFSDTIAALDAVRLAHIAEVSVQTVRN